MSKAGESWEVRYELKNAADGFTVARGHIKDHPSALDALYRLGERVGTAVAAELRPLVDPAPWKLVLSFEVVRRAEPLTVENMAKQLTAAAHVEAAHVEAAADQGEEDDSLDLSLSAVAPGKSRVEARRVDYDQLEGLDQLD